MSMRVKYSAEQLEFLRTGYLSMNVRDLTRVFNENLGMQKSEISIRSALKNHGFKCGRSHKDRLYPHFLTYTGEQAEFVRRKYTVLSISDLTVRFNEEFRTCKTESQIKAFTRNHKIKSGRTGRFEKGTKPWNTGTVGLTGANPGTFKKGDIPPNRKPLGSERIDSKDGYVQIKVAERDPHTGFPTRWKSKHTHIWEQGHGPVPAGMAVVFRDGDITNIEIDNLMLVSRAELLRLNKYGYKEMPAELKPSVLALAKLETKTFARARKV